ncbi:hypothetical protein [Marinicrinis lubricantis]|uniref:Uncharacterized protein n=1 Tax=Marinicrinis lubricantis TaxID=2086470 RepID=A0ABW1IV78_9BACL
METGATIHVQQQRRMEPFYWILTFEVFTLVLLFGISLIVGPVWLYVVFKSSWLLLLLLLIPIGIWVVKLSLQQLKRRIWHNRHLNAYRLEADRIDIQEWTPYEPQPVFGRIDLHKVNKVICGKYAAQNHYAYKSSGWHERQARIHLLPVLYIIYSEYLGEPKIVPIHFYEDDGINRWLAAFSGKGVPLSFSSTLLGDHPDPEQLRSLMIDESLIDFEFSGNIYRQMDELIEASTDKLYALQEQTVMEAGSAETGPLVIRPKKSGFGSWLAASLPAIALQVGGLFGLVLLAEHDVIDHDNFGLCFALLGMTEFVYLWMQKRRHPLHMLWFMLMIFVVMTFTGTALAERGLIADEMTTTAIGTVILYVVLVWLPYWLMRYIKPSPKQPYRNEKAGG